METKELIHNEIEVFPEPYLEFIKGDVVVIPFP
jgi:hypothetical protein